MAKINWEDKTREPIELPEFPLFRLTTYTPRHGPEREAVAVYWWDMPKILGHAHGGTQEDDEALVGWLVAHGAPAWVRDAEEGAIDEYSWFLLGPPVSENHQRHKAKAGR
jgi:hypothetical protein